MGGIQTSAISFMHKPLTCVWISERTICEMVLEAEAKLPRETGGVLVGYFDVDEAVVTEVVGPGPKAVHLPMAFRPDHDFQTSRIAAAYETSGRFHVYLGEWHTHPAGALRLSRKDRGTLARIANHKEARVPRPLMIVLAGEQEWRLAAWSCHYGRRLGFPIPRISPVGIKTY
jgi:integrative and conjugative element protein (TIGR02256 family)